MENDFSFNNSAIKKYFDGADEFAPIREIMYLHTHPLVRPNFLIEIDTLVNQAGEKLVAHKAAPNSKLVKDLQNLCIRLGQNLPEDVESAKQSLIHLRDLYNLCNIINRS